MIVVVSYDYYYEMVVVLFHYYHPDYHQTKVDVVQMKQQMDFLNDNVDDVEQ
jgi:hypothetical protein